MSTSSVSKFASPAKPFKAPKPYDLEPSPASVHAQVKTLSNHVHALLAALPVNAFYSKHIETITQELHDLNAAAGDHAQAYEPTKSSTVAVQSDRLHNIDSAV